MAQEGCLHRARDLFNELGSWQDESQKQFSNIINLHNANLIKGINDLVAEVYGLQSQLSNTAKERNVLIETVKNLNDEIRQLKSEAMLLQRLPPEPEEGQIENTEYVEDIDSEGSYGIVNGTQEESTIINSDHLYEANSYKLSDNDSNDRVQDAANEEDGQVEECAVDREAMMALKEVPNYCSKSQIRKEINTEAAKQEVIKNFECELCQYKTKSRRNLNEHINRQHNKEKIITHCNECAKAFKDKNSMKQHIRNVHFGTKKFKCEQCPFTSSYPGSLKTHIKGVHDKIKLKCGKCKYTTTQKGNLMYHMDSVHNMGDKRYKCEKCSYSSASTGNLKYHIDHHHSRK